jgi:hypothetical protein
MIDGNDCRKHVLLFVMHAVAQHIITAFVCHHATFAVVITKTSIEAVRALIDAPMESNKLM